MRDFLLSFCTGTLGYFLMIFLFVCVEVVAWICYNKGTGQFCPAKDVKARTAFIKF